MPVPKWKEITGDHRWGEKTPEQQESIRTKWVSDVMAENPHWTERDKSDLIAKTSGEPTAPSNDPYAIEEPGLQAPDFLPGLIAPENLAPAGMAMKAGAAGLRGLAAKGLEKSLNYIPRMVGNVAIDSVTSQVPKAIATDVALSAEQKFLNALKEAKVARSELGRMYHQTRRKLSGSLGEMQSKSTGEETSYAMLRHLKGKKLAEQPPQFTPLRGSLEQSDVDELLVKVHSADRLQPFERLKADEGLRKVFDGEIPQPAEMALLKDVFGKETVSEIAKLRPWSYKMVDKITAISNFPRAMMASFDASAPLRQGLVLTVSHPRKAAQAFKESWKQTFNPELYAEWLNKLKDHKLYPLMEDSKLYIADPTREAAGLAGKEERFMTDTLVDWEGLKKKLPNVGPVIERAVNMGLAPIRASERNYTTYLNKLRVDTFAQMADNFISQGMVPEENPELYKGLASFINSATGRGNMAGLQRSAQILNATFFSPRLMKARFDFLNPVYYKNLPPEVRKQALTDVGKTIGAGLTFVGMMKLGGAKVETDPRSSDWMKPRIGNTRFDPWGGFQQYVKLFSRLATKETKTSGGQVKPLDKMGSSQWDEIKRFFSYKVAPTPAYVREMLSGKKTMGGKFEYLAEEKIIPMVVQDLKEIYDENPSLLFMAGPLQFFGMGVQTYQPKPRF